MPELMQILGACYFKEVKHIFLFFHTSVEVF